MSNISKMNEVIENTMNNCKPEFVVEALVDYLTDDTEWTLQNISDESKKKVIKLANKLGQTESQQLQAKIDSLMLEFCPEEMDAEQLKEWARNQVVSDVKLCK